MLRNKTLQWGSIGLLSILIIVLSFFFRERLSEFRSLGLFGIFLANFLASATFFIPAPGIATVIAGGSLYPPLLVGLAATVGAVAGDVGVFLLGLSGESLVTEKKHVERYEKFIGFFRKWGGVTIFLFAFVPNPVFDVIGLAAGVLGYPVKKFILYLFLGRLLRNILLSFLGQQLL